MINEHNLAIVYQEGRTVRYSVVSVVSGKKELDQEIVNVPGMH